MADLVARDSKAGQYGTLITSATTETLVYTGAGLVCRFNVVTAGTASLSIYDGTQSTGGTLIFTSLTNDAVGTVKDVQFPVSTGIVVKGTTGVPSIALSYSKAGPSGN